MQSQRRLDQAIDPHAKLYEGAAGAYATYLQTTYGDNFQERQTYWQQHFEKMRARLNGFIMKRILSDRVAKLEELDFAIIGPGLKPIGKDFGNTATEEVLPCVNNVVVVDFSTAVVRSAVEDIVGSESVDSEKVLGMQFDMTDGLSSAYQNFIAAHLEQVETEDQLIQVANDLSGIEYEALYDRLIDVRGKLWQQMADAQATPAPDVLIGGGINIDRKLKLSVSGEDLKMQAWYLPMVIAGTGAAAEGQIWDRYKEVTDSSAERGGKSVDDPKTKEGRRQMIKDFYTLISRYNTLAATTAISHILNQDSNPNARVLAVSDVSTVMNALNLGLLPRLDISILRHELDENGIDMQIADIDWKWKDEPDHHHGVNAFTFMRRGHGGASINVPSEEGSFAV